MKLTKTLIILIGITLISLCVILPYKGIIYEIKSGEEMDIALDYYVDGLDEESDEHWELSDTYSNMASLYYGITAFVGSLFFGFSMFAYGTLEKEKDRVWLDNLHRCPKCNWEGTVGLMIVKPYKMRYTYHCPNCGKTLKDEKL